LSFLTVLALCLEYESDLCAGNMDTLKELRSCEESLKNVMFAADRFRRNWFHSYYSALLCIEIFAPCANVPVARGSAKNGIARAKTPRTPSPEV